MASSLTDLSSDHSPVLITMSNNLTPRATPCTLHNKRTNWDVYREELQYVLTTEISLKTEEDIVMAVEHFNKCVQSAAWNATPPSKNGNQAEWIAESIKDLISKRRCARKEWQKYRSPEHKTTFNNATKTLKIALQDHDNRLTQEHLSSLDATRASDYSLWKATSQVNSSVKYNPPLRNSSGSWARSDKEKSEAFACHLSQVFKPNNREVDENEEKFINQALAATHQLELPIKAFTKGEVANTIKQLKLKKSPGYDLITPKCLKELPKKGITFLTHLINAILRMRYFPPQWKVATIIMINKPGKPEHQVTSYRPISLLPITSKLFEKLFLKRLLPVITQKQLIPSHQFGFRQNHSTVEQVHRLVDKIRHDMESKKYCSAVFLDVTQAFDRVWHDGLLYKIKTTLPETYYTIIKSYLSNRYFTVKQGEHTTSLNTIKSGVPQGSVLGPVLYLLFTADLPVNDLSTVATYADDTAILSSHEDPSVASQLLQTDLANIEKWLKLWRIKVNETKSAHVTFTLRRQTCPPVTMNGNQIPQYNDTKYLGIHLDRKLTWQKHIFTKRLQLSLKLRKYQWMLGRRSRLSLENKLLIYKIILKPIWTYGIQLWGTASKTNLNILQRFQSKVLRMITDAPWYVTNDTLHKDLQIPTVEEEIENTAKKYVKRLVVHPNDGVKKLAKARPLRRLKRKLPQDLWDT